MKELNNNSLYHIFLSVIRLHYNRTRILFEKCDIYPGQPPLVILLHHKNGQSQKELAKQIRISPATLTVMIKRMEKAGLLERKQDEVDQRVSRVFLTNKGEESYKQINETMNKINDRCFAHFTEDEKLILRRLMMQLRENLENFN